MSSKKENNLIGAFAANSLDLGRFNTQLFMGNKKLPDTLGFMIVSTGKLLVKNFNGIFSKLATDITFDQMGVLYYISNHEGEKVIQQDIAEVMDKTKSAILRSIDILEQKGYVKRQPDPIDRRNNILELTPSGKEIIEKMHSVFSNLEKELITGLETKDKETCVSVLNQIQAKYKC